jgi:hypothetical protein
MPNGSSLVLLVAVFVRGTILSGVFWVELAYSKGVAVTAGAGLGNKQFGDPDPQVLALGFTSVGGSAMEANALLTQAGLKLQGCPAKMIEWLQRGL